MSGQQPLEIGPSFQFLNHVNGSGSLEGFIMGSQGFIGFLQEVAAGATTGMATGLDLATGMAWAAGMALATGWALDTGLSLATGLACLLEQP